MAAGTSPPIGYEKDENCMDLLNKLTHGVHEKD